jgi:fucose permease
MLAAAGLMILDNASTTKAGIILFGVGTASMYPNVMTLTPLRFGRDVALHTIGFQVSAAQLSAAVVPGLAGVISESAGLVAIPVLVTLIAALVIVLETALRTRIAHANTLA